MNLEATLPVGEAVRVAREAQPAWEGQPLQRRMEVLARFHQRLFARRDDVVACISRETGKPLAEALAVEVSTTLDQVRFVVRHAPHAFAPRRTVPEALALWRKRLVTEHRAWGVVGVIAPWNYPFMLPSGTVAALLAAGNAVVLKPSEFTPATGELLGELLAESGLPAGLLHVLPSERAVGRALVEASVDKVFFTGSVETGTAVAQACAARLIPCVLELGGCDPAIVLPDADPTRTARGLTWGRFANAGQTCVASKRVIAVGEVYEPLVEAMCREVASLRLRSGGRSSWDMGDLIRPEAAEPLARLRDDAVARGARAVSPAAGEGTAFAPTLLLDVPKDARVLREEAFGPLLPVIRAATIEEGIALANANPFGLSASVWSSSRARARAVAGELACGTVAINDVAVVAGIAEVEHGGWKASGWGRSHGIEGLREAVRTRTIVDDVWPGRAQPWWFPYDEGLGRDLDGYVRLAHGGSPWARLSGLAATLRLLRRR